MRRIKSLGLAAVMALALMAILGAGTAPAKVGFIADEYPATLKGQQGQAILSLGSSGKMECTKEGHVLTGTLSKPAAGLSAATSGGTTYCYAFGIKQALNLNGCKIGLTPQGTTEIGPAGCGPVRFESTYCDATIQPQTGTGTVSYSGGGTVGASASLTNFTYTVNGGWGCPKGTHHNGTYTPQWTIAAYNAGGKQIDLDYTSVGLSVGGTPPGFQPAGLPPLPVSGKQTQPLEFFFPSVGWGGWASCNTMTAHGELGLGSQLTLVPQFGSSCWAHGFGGATFTTNDCLFRLDVHSTGPPYVGDGSIGCINGGSIEIAWKDPFFGGPLCKITVGSQFDLAGVTYSNVGSGNTAGISAAINLKGIKYKGEELVKGGCYGPVGAFEDGTLRGTITLHSF